MRGGSLTRFRPDNQSGSGFLRDFTLWSLRSGWEGLKTGGRWGLPNIAGGIHGMKRGGKRAIKQSLGGNQPSRQKETLQHFWRMNPIYSRRVRRIPPISSAMSQGRRRRRVQKGSTFLPTRTKRLNYDWVRSALKKKRKRRQRR